MTRRKLEDSDRRTRRLACYVTPAEEEAILKLPDTSSNVLRLAVKAWLMLAETHPEIFKEVSKALDRTIVRT